MTDQPLTTMNDTGPQQCRRLLVVCTGTERDGALLREVMPYADQWNARVHLLSVIETGADVDHVARALGVTREEVARRVARDRRVAMEAFAREALPGRDCDITVTTGKPFIEIVRYVLTNDIDFLVKRAESVRGAARFLFASTDQHLLRKCPCPVWLRRETSTPSGRVVLASLDVDYAMAGEPDTLKALNKRILETAVLLAAATDADVHALHVWDAPAEGLVRAYSDGANAHTVVESYVDQVHTSHWRTLQRLLESVDPGVTGSPAPRAMKPLLERGDAVEVIASHVSEHPPVALVMGTVARTGLSGLIIGNTAEDIINSIECPVVTVKPPGFTTPVQLD